MTRLWPFALLVLAAAGPAAAQLPAIFPPGSPIKDLWYPKIFWTSRNGFTAGGYYAIMLPHTYETYDQPPPYQAAVQLDGQVSVSGSRHLALDAVAPLLVDGWRFRLTASAQRRNRADYYGLGNGSVFDESNTTGEPLYYRIRHVRFFARGEIQRRIAGGLRVLAGGHMERWRMEPLAAGTQLAIDTASPGFDPSVGRTVSDAAVRFGAVFDTRDDESAPRRGVLLEAVQTLGRADDESYTRTYVSARGYLPLSQRFALAGRVAGQRMGGTPRIGTLYLVEATDGPFVGIGGSETHRALFRERLLGRHKLYGNLDAIFTLFEIPTLVRVKLLGFVDAGRVFEGEDFRLTTDDLAVGAGGGFLLHLFRNAILGLTGAGGPDGFVLHAHTSWPY